MTSYRHVRTEVEETSVGAKRFRIDYLESTGTYEVSMWLVTGNRENTRLFCLYGSLPESDYQKKESEFLSGMWESLKLLAHVNE